ncbi:Transducin/WD40 repeat-like superfamily protein [Striga hermonthica]|uniref:RING-type E3 ubiquitin transferase n=1 Tax=Striga hermonthica TaxID=68872 RepID=A0A9N7NH51_STRHE|nr:Transducin/WD40 repeat-like superfamily protein [Striga hermonthica]
MDPDYRGYLLFHIGVEGFEDDDDDDDEDYQEEEQNEDEEEEDEDEEEEEEDEGEEETEDEEDNSDGADEGELDGNNGDGNSVTTGTTPSGEVVIIEDGDATEEGERERGCKKGRVGGGGEGGETASLNGGEFGEFSRGEVDGLFCPICFEAWSSGGDHHICCLPCGHIYGLSCIRKWLARRGSSKCPQCKKNCRMKDIRLLYASQIVAIDGELQKTVRSLEAKCASLEKQGAEWFNKELEWKIKERDLRKQVQYLEERTRNLEVLLANEECRASGSSASNWNSLGPDASSNFHMQGCSNKFTIQKEFQIEGARLFDVDSSSENYIFARRLLGMGGMHVLTKVCLLYSNKKEDIQLPENTKAVKDLRLSPDAKLVLLASLGKKLSIVSTESNNNVLTWDLQAAAWSCSWDVSDSHYVYTGLQNGTVLQFDVRHNMRYVESLNGLTCNPVHSLYSLSPSSSRSSSTRNVLTKNILTASSLGLCQWDFGVNQETPYLFPESDEQEVCISLAHCKTSDDIVASYRPKIEITDGLTISQPTQSAAGQGTWGTHIYYEKNTSGYKKFRTICAKVSDIRLPKSTIIDGVYEDRVFASGDESTGELVLYDLPFLSVSGRIKLRSNPIRDVKYVRGLHSGLLSCLSEDTLQLYTAAMRL